MSLSLLSFEGMIHVNLRVLEGEGLSIRDFDFGFDMWKAHFVVSCSHFWPLYPLSFLI